MDVKEDNTEFNEWVLEPYNEYRFELDPDSSLAIKLVQGDAELFGAELALGRTYLFGAECKAAVFTWHGCTLEVTGKASTEYISDETPMVPYSNLHLAFEQMRVLANRASRGSPPPPPHDEGDQQPPRILIIGPENSGKTTAAKILANYAVRSPGKWAPMLVNLDTSDGGFTVPGTISAVAITSPLFTSSPANTLGATATSAPTALSSSALIPLVYWFGHAEAKRSPMLMERRIRQLARNVKDRLALDKLGEASGMIIDSPASFASASLSRQSADQKYPLVQATVQAFDVNMILVVGHEKLNVEMQRMFGGYGSHITVVKVPKSGGVAELDHAYRSRLYAHQQRTYFYGTQLYLPQSLQQSNASSAVLGGEASTELTLSPHSSVVKFDDIAIYRIGGEILAPSSALPIGAAPALSETLPMRIDPAAPGSGLLNTLLALLTPIPSTPGSGHEPDGEEIVERDVAGFLLINAIDIPNRKMTLLAPSPGASLAGRIAITGSFEWQDQ